MSFLENLEKNLNEINNLTNTENGAVGYKSTNHPLLDMNFKVPSYRTASTDTITMDFFKSYNDNELLAILWMFFARDVRGGLGERRLFRILFNWVCNNNPDVAKRVLPFIPKYGRWDDLIVSTEDTRVWYNTLSLIKSQLTQDIKNHSEGKGISLLAKWLPSERTSSQKSRKLARKIAQGIGFPIKNYNKVLVTLRKHLDIVETKMSAKEWEAIDYAAVPSKANLIYNNAFLRNDEERRRSYLESLEKGDTKINSSALFPHEIIHKYTYGSWHTCLKERDTTLEEMWKALPNVGGLEDTIVVADGSGSMSCPVGGTRTTALDVANAIAIYCSDHCKGEYKGKYITFSHTPQFVNVGQYNSLHDKIKEAFRHDEVSNTNIEGVFDLILDTAIQHNTPQNEIPKSILIISDMEFDMATDANSGWGWGRATYPSPSDALFKKIEQRYKNAGYQIPRLVFWNVNSRTNTIPVMENDLGVTLVSGFSLSIIKMVQSGELDPYINLIKMVTNERYQPVIEALKNE